MQRHEVWLAVVINAMVGALTCVAVHAYTVAGHLPLELWQSATVIAVALLGLVVSGLVLLSCLRR